MALAEYVPKIVQQALSYASLGLHVFPLYGTNDTGCVCGDSKCTSPGKHPLKGSRGFHDASVDSSVIKDAFGSHGIRNLGIRTGLNFWVLDLDQPAPEDWPQLDAAWVAKTPRGGFHYYYALAPGETIACSVGKIAPKIDVRGDGGYVAAPPSKGLGGPYAWHKDKNPNTRKLEMCPAWLWEIVVASSKLEREKIDPSLEAPEGSRNDYIFRLASSTRAQGIPYDLAEAQILFAASRCKPPFDEREARETIKGVYERYPSGSTISIVETRPGAEAQESKEFPLTDLGNAERLLFRLGGNVRYCKAFGRWMFWNSRIWNVDETGGAPIIQAAAEMARDMGARAEGARNEVERKALKSWALKCESAARIKSAVELASMLDGVAISPDDLDKNPMIFCCANGTIDLTTGKLKEPDKNDLATLSSPTIFDPTAECPLFEQFIEWCASGDTELVDFLQVSLGYTLTGLTSEEALFFAHGAGDNGKSTLFNVLLRIWGTYAKSIKSDDLMAQQGGKTIETTIARMKGARLIIANETNAKSLAESTVKSLASKDRLVARVLYGHEFEFWPTHKMWIAGNHKPKINNNDHGIWRRIRLIPFLNKIEESAKDLRLEEKLLAESSGILRFCLIGLEHYLQNRLPVSAKIVNATEQYREDMDVLGEFIDEYCEVGEAYGVKVGSLFEKYKKWAEASGHGVLSVTSFSMKVQERGFEKGRAHGGVRIFKGIQLKEDDYDSNVYRG